MNRSQTRQRTLRSRKPGLEQLDERITPSTMHGDTALVLFGHSHRYSMTTINEHLGTNLQGDGNGGMHWQRYGSFRMRHSHHPLLLNMTVAVGGTVTAVSTPALQLNSVPVVSLANQGQTLATPRQLWAQISDVKTTTPVTPVFNPVLTPSQNPVGTTTITLPASSDPATGSSSTTDPGTVATGPTSSPSNTNSSPSSTDSGPSGLRGAGGNGLGVGLPRTGNQGGFSGTFASAPSPTPISVTPYYQ